MKRHRLRIRWRRPARSRPRSRPGAVKLTVTPASATLSPAHPGRRVFYSSEPEKPSARARRRRKARRIYIRSIRVIRAGGTVILTWQVISVSGSAYRKLEKLSEEERDSVIDAIADVLEEPLWEVLADGWETVDVGDFGELAEAASALQDALKRCLIGDPVKLAGSALGLADLSLLGAIAERVPIPVIDRSLGDIRHYAEIAGIVLVVLAGGHILACASFKLWVHDKLGQLLAKLIDTVLRDLGGKPVQSPSPAGSADSGEQPPGRPDPPTSRSGPPPAPSGGFPARSNPSAGRGQPGPEPAFPATPATASTGPVTAGTAPASATRTRVRGPAASIGQHRPDPSQADAIQKAQPPRVRAADRAVEPEMEADIRTSASASLAGPAEIREVPEVPEVGGGLPPRAVTAERRDRREAADRPGGQRLALHGPGWPGPAETPETPRTPRTQPGDNRTAPGDERGIDRTAGKGSPGFSR